jgi:hypothetical protein
LDNDVSIRLAGFEEGVNLIVGLNLLRRELDALSWKVESGAVEPIDAGGKMRDIERRMGELVTDWARAGRSGS